MGSDEPTVDGNNNSEKPIIENEIQTILPAPTKTVADCVASDDCPSNFQLDIELQRGVGLKGFDSYLKIHKIYLK